MRDSLVIHKYVLPFVSERSASVMVPVRPGTLLRADVQNGKICAWVMVDLKSELIEREFILVGTGGYVEPRWYHIGTMFQEHITWSVFSAERVWTYPIS